MKRKILVFVLWGLPALAAAQATVALPLVNQNVDVSGLIGNLKPGYGFTNHRDSLGTVTVPLMSYSQGGLPVADLNVGFVFAQSGGAPITAGGGGAIAALGLRVDSLMGLAGNSQWFKSHISAAPLPAFEIGPLGGYYKNGGGWIWGLYVSKRLGGP